MPDHYSIQIANEQRFVKCERTRLKRAVQLILADARIPRAEISLALVDDATIHAINQQFLAHDFPTDVVTFALGAENGPLEGEIVASAETAARMASIMQSADTDELLLYVIHGVLHLVGYDDMSARKRAKMREAERHYMAIFDAQLTPRTRQSRLRSDKLRAITPSERRAVRKAMPSKSKPAAKSTRKSRSKS